MNRPSASTRFHTDNNFQWVLSAATVIGSWLTVRPLGLTGIAGVTLALLVINSVFIFIRLIKTGAVSYRLELSLLICWGIAAAALVALQSLSVAAAFAYLMTGSTGYRLSRRPALAVATLVGVLTTLGLLLNSLAGNDGWPWLLGLTISWPVFLGMSNRSRDLAIESALEAAAAAQRAAESEAKAQTLVERARISRDVHDVLAHSLSGVSMQLELSDLYLETGNVAGAREAIGRAHSMVREGMSEARRAVQDSRAQVLPLVQTLSSLFTGAAEVQVSGNVAELPTETTQTLIRVAQEALTNARRHARDAEITVELAYLPDSVRLEIRNAEPVDSLQFTGGSGMGLVGMRERVMLAGGNVEVGPISTGPLSGGWHVTVTLPV